MDVPLDGIAIEADEAPPRCLDRRSFDRLCRVGLSAREAGQLTAHLVGLPPPRGAAWEFVEIQRLVFLRWLVTTGRIGS
jgi:hypothetical protein